MNRYNIGRRIEAYREKLRMSTQELAERIGRSQATISRIENGKQGLTFELLAAIATELQVHPFALLSDEPLRNSVLLPPETEGGPRYVPNLLANALHAGRVKRRMHIDDAARLAGIAAGELEAIELSALVPEDDVLVRLGTIYGLVPQQIRVLKQFSREAPDIARGLAYLQQLFSHTRHLIRQLQDGDEKRALEHIATLLDSADSEYPLPPDLAFDTVNLFLNRLSLHLVNALKDQSFSDTMAQIAGLQPQDTGGR